MLESIKSIFKKSDRREVDGTANMRGVQVGVHLAPNVRPPNTAYFDLLQSGNVEDAFFRLKLLTSESTANKIWYLYPEWRQAYLSGQDVLSSRKGREWIDRHLSGVRRTWSLTTAGIRLYRIMALREGILAPSPHYTGTSSVPPYRRKKGI